jgi:hypothetical protein
MAEEKCVLVVDDDSAFPEGRGVCRGVLSCSETSYAVCKELTGSTYSDVDSTKTLPGSNDLKTKTS